jgi:hypothetical protein
MQGSLGLGNGLLFVGRHEKTAHVSVHDLDGRELPFGFSFKDEHTGRSEVTGLAVDPDRHVWVADAPGRRVRRFNVFGREIGGLPREGERAGLADEVGAIAAPVDVALVDAPDTDEGFLLAVASGGARGHAVQLFRPDGACEATLRPAGDRPGRFHHVRRVAALGNLLFVVESGARRLQVFRGLDFHYHVQVPGRARAHCEPVA